MGQLYIFLDGCRCLFLPQCLLVKLPDKILMRGINELLVTPCL